MVECILGKKEWDLKKIQLFPQICLFWFLKSMVPEICVGLVFPTPVKRLREHRGIAPMV